MGNRIKVIRFSKFNSFCLLSVSVRPLKMVLTGVEHHVVEGTKVLLQCIVYGARPAAKVTWYNGTEVMPEDFVTTDSAVKVIYFYYY